MRLIVFFDLPVKTKKDRKEYCRFRSFLLRDGYVMLQFSVYSRICNGIDAVEKHLEKLRNNLPPKGSIRALRVTEKQYARMEFLLGEKPFTEKKVADQLSLFL